MARASASTFPSGATTRDNNRRVSWLDVLELLGRLPAEAWLVPPVVIIGTAVAVGIYRHRAQLRRYRAIAARAGLSVKSSIVNPSQVHGTYAGRQLVMTTTSSRSSAFFRKTWTCVSIDVRNRASVALRLRRKDVIDRLLRLGDAPVGDKAFDHRFLIRSRDRGYVMMIFGDRMLRDTLMRADIEGIRLVGSSLEVFYRREERSPDHAVLLFDGATRLADEIDRLGAGRL